MIVADEDFSFCDGAGFRETFDQSMRYLKLEHVDLLSIHGINNAELLAWALRPGRLRGCRPGDSTRRGAAAGSASAPCDHGLILRPSRATRSIT